MRWKCFSWEWASWVWISSCLLVQLGKRQKKNTLEVSVTLKKLPLSVMNADTVPPAPTVGFTIQPEENKRLCLVMTEKSFHIRNFSSWDFSRASAIATNPYWPFKTRYYSVFRVMEAKLPRYQFQFQSSSKRQENLLNLNLWENIFRKQCA